MAIPKLYTRKELAENLKVDIRTIDKWRREGKITGKKIGSVVRFSETQVLKLLQDKVE